MTFDKTIIRLKKKITIDARRLRAKSISRYHSSCLFPFKRTKVWENLHYNDIEYYPSLHVKSKYEHVTYTKRNSFNHVLELIQQ